MTGQIRFQIAVRRCVCRLGEGSVRFAAVCLLVSYVLLAGRCAVAAQVTEQDGESRDIILELSEDETGREELPTGKRDMLEFPVPLLTDEDKDREAGKDSRESAARTATSESELWQTMRQLRSDLEMLKEEIAQLRSEFRSLMPNESEEEDISKRTVNPFWITDVQLEQQEPD